MMMQSKKTTLHKNPQDVKLWVIVPIVIMVLVNMGFWFAYVEDQRVTSTGKEPKIATLWGYFQSDIFKAIMASLIIPIFMFLFERRFKILENYQASKAERRSQLIRESRERRWETIKNTLAMWNNLDKLASEAVFFEKSRNDRNGIKELQKRIENFPSEAEDIVNEWNYRFPNLSDDDNLVLVNHINHLFEPTRTVASFIEDDIDKKNSDVHDLQLSLNIIRGGIKDSVHQNLISVLKQSLDLLDIIEDNNQEVISTIDNLNDLIDELPNEKKEKICKIEEKIDDEINTLKQTDKNIFSTIEPYWEILPNVNDKKETEHIEKYSEAYLDTRSEFEKDPSIDNYFNSEASLNFSAAYYDVPHKLHIKASRYDLTRDGIKVLADWFNNNAKIDLACAQSFVSKSEDSMTHSNNIVKNQKQAPISTTNETRVYADGLHVDSHGSFWYE